MLNDHRPAALHGAKVGIASLITAAWYAQARQMSRDEAARRLQDARLPDAQDEIDKIRRAFGPLADELIAIQKDFLAMTPDDFQALKQRILDHWEQVQEIAAGVPAPEQLSGWLRTVGGPLRASQVGLSEAELRLAADTSHYMRNRFTINKLRLLLGMPTLVNDGL